MFLVSDVRQWVLGLGLCELHRMSNTKHHGDKNKQKLYGDNWQWYRSEPKSWRRWKKHKPQRAATRRAEHRVIAGLDDYRFWPSDKKPWSYYW